MPALLMISVKESRIPGRRWLLGAALLGCLQVLEANTAVVPTPRDASWLRRHESFVSLERKDEVDVLFIGDSITDYWRREDPLKGGLPVWRRYFAPLGAANFGIASDRTQHVLWRLSHGELEGLSPKVIVLMIGTNNTGFERDGVTPRNTPPEIVAGVTAIVRTLREKVPSSRILLLAIFPRGEKQDPQRAQVAAVNRELAKLHDGEAVHYLDLSSRFLTDDGTLPRALMPDLLHPGEKGYEFWAESIKEPLNTLLASSPLQP